MCLKLSNASRVNSMFLLKKGEFVGSPSKRFPIPVVDDDENLAENLAEKVIVPDVKKPVITVNPSIARAAAAQPQPQPQPQQSSLPVPIPSPAVVDVTSMLKGADNGTSSKLRVLLCGTYPIGQSNGYSRVVYYICKHLGLKEDIKLTVYGFQNYNQTIGDQRRDVPPSVTLYDALANENPKRNGFGEKEIADFIKANPQDIVMIFNDPVITTSLTQNIMANMTAEERGSFKLISYMDQVYPYQKKAYIQLLNDVFDGIITFTPYWMKTAQFLGIKKDMPLYFFPHGFDTETYYPIPQHIARVYHQMDMTAFYVLNLNRNQPRKRWDHTIMAFADVAARHQKLLANKSKVGPAPKPIQLVIATQAQGFWDLFEIMEHELKLRNLDPALAKTYLKVIPNAQQLTDRDINILYNACDIGLNTCEGEGFGLCQFEHLALGCPQVAPNIGGFKEFLNSQNSIVIEPKWSYYVDKQRDGIGGLAEVSNPVDFADGIWKYYQNPSLVSKHGKRGHMEVLQHYRWESMVDVLYDVLQCIRK